MKRLFALLAAATVLTSCSRDYPGLETGVDPKTFLSSLDGPEVPTIDKSLLKTANEMEAAGNFRSASQIYGQLLEKNPENPAYMLKMAEVLRRDNDLDKALDLYDRALAKDASNTAAMEGKALTLLAKGNPDDAGALLAQVQEKAPDRWKTLNAIGILFAARGSQTDAHYYFSRALEKNPGNTTLLNNIGLQHAIERDYPQATARLQEAAAKLGSDDSLRRNVELNLALVYGVAGRLDEAEKIAKKYYSGAALSTNMGLYAHLAEDDALAKTYFNEALVQSKTYYERAWKNLDAISTNPSPAPNAGKRIVVGADGAGEKPEPAWVKALRAPAGTLPASHNTAASAPVTPVKEGLFGKLFSSVPPAATAAGPVAAKEPQPTAKPDASSTPAAPEVLATSDALKNSAEATPSTPALTKNPFGADTPSTPKNTPSEPQAAAPKPETSTTEESKETEGEDIASKTANGFQALGRWIKDAVP